MDKNKIVQDLFGESHLVKDGFLSTCVFFYLAGRYPDLTIKQAVDVIELARKECAKEK